MQKALALSLVGLAVLVGCGSSDATPFGEAEAGDGGTSSGGAGGSSSGGASGSGTSGIGGDFGGGASGGTAGYGGTTADGGTTSTGGSGGALGGSTAIGGTAGTFAGAAGDAGGITGGAGAGGSAGAVSTDPSCPVNQPAGGSRCAPAGLSCPYIANGCRCLTVYAGGCFQMDASCVPAAAADRVAAPPVHYCSCVATTEELYGWSCTETTL